MMAVSHIAVGAACWAVVARAAGLDPADPQALGIAALGSLLPDIDHPQSWAGRKMRLVSVPLAMLVGHRGITHSLIAVLAAILLLGAIGLGAALAPLVIGYLSHLAADSCTPSGVPLLWPNKRRFTLNLCRTGSLIEIGIVALVTGAGAWAAGIDPRQIEHLRPLFP